MKKILIIDDRTTVRQFFVEELQARSFEVWGTGVDGRVHEMVEEFRPDLVLLDPFSRWRFRWDLLIALKEMNPCLPVLLLTTFDNPLVDPSVNWAEGVVAKNYDLQELLDRIAALGREAQASGASRSAEERRIDDCGRAFRQGKMKPETDPGETRAQPYKSVGSMGRKDPGG